METQTEQMYVCDYCNKDVMPNDVSFVYPTISEPVDQFKKVKAICPVCLEYGKAKLDKKGFNREV